MKEERRKKKEEQKSGLAQVICVSPLYFMICQSSSM